MTDNAVEILLVEDNPDDEELTLRSLNRHHLANHTHIVRDGAEALDWIFRTGACVERVNQLLKLILLDLKLPKIAGLEVLHQLKSDPQTRMIPIVVLTSSREERDVIGSYESGVNSYITKVVDFDQFSEAIRQLGFY